MEVICIRDLEKKTRCPEICLHHQMVVATAHKVGEEFFRRTGFRLTTKELEEIVNDEFGKVMEETSDLKTAMRRNCLKAQS